MFRRIRLVAWHLSPLILALPAFAQAVRVNAPLARGVAGDVTSARISPDGARVVFRADQEEDEVHRLYAVPIEGGPVKRLTPALAPGGDVTSFEIGPRSRRVVYVADQDADEVLELYSVGLVGHLPGTKLSGPLVAGGDVQGFWIAPLSEDVVYLADQEVDQRAELYRVPIAGGPVTKLNAPLAAGARVDLVRITPDGTRVLYRTLDAGGLFDLWSVPITGGSAVQLDPPLESPSRFEITPDSREVVFQGSFSGSKLFLASVLGGAPTELAGDARGFLVWPGAQAVLYLAFGQQVRDQLFLVPLHGGAPRQLTEHGGARVSGVYASADGRWVEYATEFGDANGPVYTLPLAGGSSTMIDGDGDEMFVTGITPDSRLLLYTSFGGTHGGQPALFAAPVDGGPPMRLTDRDLVPVAFTPDSTAVLALAGDVFVGEFGQLLRVSLADGSSVQLNPPFVEGGTVVGTPLLSPDGSRVVYRAEQDLDGVVELYSVPIGGGPAVKLNGPLSTDGIAGDVRGVQVSPNGRRIVYLADQDTDEVLELYSAPATGGPPVRLNGPLVRNGDVVDGLFRISSDSTRVVYLADERIDGVRELFSVPIDGGPSVRLNGPGTIGVLRFELDSAGERVVFTSQTLGPNLTELFSVSIVGGPIADLSGSLADLETVQDWGVAPDGSRVAFAARRAGDGVEAELYSVPLDGGTALRISPTPVADGGIAGLRVLGDSSAVVYSGALEVAGRYDLWWTPLAGGPSERLSGTIDADQDILVFEASPDSHHVVYRVERFQQGLIHAVSLPDFTRTRLSPQTVAGGSVLDFKITPDSSRVVYRADQIVDNDIELFSIPIAGGTATRLNGPLVNGGDVGAFQVSPGSSRVVYFADQLANDVFELFSVPIAGGPSTRLSAPFPNGGDISTFAIDDTGRSVVYQADQRVNDRQELFVVPITGGAAPLALNPPLPPAGDVEGPPPPPFFFVQPFVLAGHLVLFHADLTTDGVYDLYRVPLPILGPPRARQR